MVPAIMHIAYPVRIDSLEKSGGDLIQVREYIAGGAGAYNGGNPLFTGETLTDPQTPLDRFDLVHLTNLDRPFETYAFYLAAKAAGKKVVFSPIHHSYREIAAYEQQGRAGAFSNLTAMLSFRTLEGVRTLIRARRYPGLLRMFATTLRAGVAKAQLQMLRGAERVLVLSWKERDDILFDCPGSDSCKFTRLFNGLPPIPEAAKAGTSAAAPALRDIDVCVVSRIEARKNQLLILDALDRLQVTGVFVGAENANHAVYCKAFKDRIASSKSQYLGSLSREATIDIMRRSRVHVSASWFEVLSLVDLEAYASGCQIVSSRCGGTQDVLADAAIYVCPSNPSELEQAIRHQLIRSTQLQGEGLRLQSWGKIVEELAAVYRETLGR
jgi:glycosyltransferase involved in cell wall biosynthesis